MEPRTYKVTKIEAIIDILRMWTQAKIVKWQERVWLAEPTWVQWLTGKISFIR